MFPLSLIPTVPDDLEKMTFRKALPYQNAFMKNALIRALNGIYDSAPRIKPSHAAFRPFMEYVEMVCDMTSLHVQGDEVFANSLYKSCKAYQFTSNKYFAVARNAVGSLRRLASDWRKDGRSYNAGHIQSSLNGMEGALIEVFHKQVPKFSPDVVPPAISDEVMVTLITEHMVWLTTNSDIAILVPFCISHHDTKTSKHWPPMGEEGKAQIPGLVKKHASHWKFAPFDPVSRQGVMPAF